MSRFLGSKEENLDVVAGSILFCGFAGRPRSRPAKTINERNSSLRAIETADWTKVQRTILRSSTICEKEGFFRCSGSELKNKIS